MDDLTRAVDLLMPLVTNDGDADQRLLRHGWRSTDHRSWSSGGCTGHLFPDLFEVTLLAEPGDVDDTEYEERLHEEFTALFEDGVRRLRPRLGAPDVVGEVGQDGFPEELDAAMTAM